MLPTTPLQDLLAIGIAVVLGILDLMYLSDQYKKGAKRRETIHKRWAAGYRRKAEAGTAYRRIRVPQANRNRPGNHHCDKKKRCQQQLAAEKQMNT